MTEYDVDQIAERAVTFYLLLAAATRPPRSGVWAVLAVVAIGYAVIRLLAMNHRLGWTP